MLLELHIRNMALIEKADLDFRSGFTVLSGETGAGKSILIDSINFALGAKTSKEIIREGAEFAYVELIFKILDKEKIEYIKSLDFNILEDGILIISRKLSASRSILKHYYSKIIYSYRIINRYTWTAWTSIFIIKS